ncbi:MAG: flagellar basal body-associated FliL family protein [Phycisphaerales bacterium]|nr:MAG: flagellar basal body-associated FliL family protein [Phycisphaerales bacterium]UCF17579.1 MAG: flagellar basal body-associated FliL family protein [Phycisphaerales bacterium]
MADADEKKDQNQKKAEKSKKKFLIGRFLPWMIIGVVILVCACGGFGLGRMLASPAAPPPSEVDQKVDEVDQEVDLTPDEVSVGDFEQTWFYDMDPVIANLNEPGVSRYVRASFTLEISAEIDRTKGTAFLDEKKPILTDMLFVFLSGLSLKDIQGDKNLKSIQSRIRELFNEKLFPDSKPQIKRVLIKEFPVQ